MALASVSVTYYYLKPFVKPAAKFISKNIIEAWIKRRKDAKKGVIITSLTDAERTEFNPELRKLKEKISKLPLWIILLLILLMWDASPIHLIRGLRRDVEILIAIIICIMVFVKSLAASSRRSSRS